MSLTADNSNHSTTTNPELWRRLAARTVDVITVGTWMFALTTVYVLFHLQLWSETIAPEPWGTWFLVAMTFTVLFAVYEILFTCRTGSTPGKDLFHLQVVDHHTGARPTFGQATRRWFLLGIAQPIPSALIGTLVTLGLGATALVDGDRRALHDRLAGTRVIEKARPESTEEQQDRRRQFMPRFFDPLAVYRAARSGDPSALRNHPSDPNT